MSKVDKHNRITAGFPVRDGVTLRCEDTRTTAFLRRRQGVITVEFAHDKNPAPQQRSYPVATVNTNTYISIAHALIMGPPQAHHTDVVRRAVGKLLSRRET